MTALPPTSNTIEFSKVVMAALAAGIVGIAAMIWNNGLESARQGAVIEAIQASVHQIGPKFIDLREDLARLRAEMVALIGAAKITTDREIEKLDRRMDELEKQFHTLQQQQLQQNQVAPRPAMK